MNAGSKLELIGVSRIFDSGVPVRALDSIDLTIKSGEYLAVTGRSGSGKSTLLNVLGLIDKPTTGSYSIDGIDTSAMRESELDRLRGEKLGIVFQSFHLLDYFSTAENVTLGLTYSGLSRKQKLGRVSEVVEQVGLTHRQHARTATLSGGERQRAAIARTLARRPGIFLADEPTGNLDEENAEAVLEIFDEINRSGVTLILVTHDPETADRCRRRIHLRDGHISEDISQ